MEFALVNSVDPDEMPHLAAFHLGLHCLPKYPFRAFQVSKGLSGCENIAKIVGY